MKNFQQTPKMRRLAMTAHKATLAGSRPQSFHPREAWSTKQKLGGVPLSVLDEKQHGKMKSIDRLFPPIWSPSW